MWLALNQGNNMASHYVTNGKTKCQPPRFINKRKKRFVGRHPSRPSADVMNATVKCGLARREPPKTGTKRPAHVSDRCNKRAATLAHHQMQSNSIRFSFVDHGLQGATGWPYRSHNLNLIFRFFNEETCQLGFTEKKRQFAFRSPTASATNHFDRANFS